MKRQWASYPATLTAVRLVTSPCMAPTWNNPPSPPVSIPATRGQFKFNRMPHCTLWTWFKLNYLSTLCFPYYPSGLHNFYHMSYLYFGAMATSSVVLVGLIVSYATGEEVKMTLWNEILMIKKQTKKKNADSQLHIIHAVWTIVIVGEGWIIWSFYCVINVSSVWFKCCQRLSTSKIYFLLQCNNNWSPLFVF